MHKSVVNCFGLNVIWDELCGRIRVWMVEDSFTSTLWLLRLFCWKLLKLLSVFDYLCLGRGGMCFVIRPLSTWMCFFIVPLSRAVTCWVADTPWDEGGLRLGRWVGGGTHYYLLERLLSGVCADVVVEGGGAGKRSAAVSTFEGPVTGVCHHVVPQLGRLREGQGAVSALVRPVSRRGGGGGVSLHCLNYWCFFMLFSSTSATSPSFLPSCMSCRTSVPHWVHLPIRNLRLYHVKLQTQ